MTSPLTDAAHHKRCDTCREGRAVARSAAAAARHTGVTATTITTAADAGELPTFATLRFGRAVRRQFAIVALDHWVAGRNRQETTK